MKFQNIFVTAIALSLSLACTKTPEPPQPAPDKEPGEVADDSSAKAWQNFVAGNQENVLPDFSYAGYNHGETAPADGFALNYEVVNVKQYMEETGKTARQALISILEARNLTYNNGHNGNAPNAKLVIYFPEGDYVLHNEDDNTFNPDLQAGHYATDSKGNNTSHTININGGHLVFKGDGPDKTRLIMDSPMLPTDSQIMYSSGCLLQFKHNNGLSKLCDVVSDAAKGSYTVEVGSTLGLSAGDWVCLYLQNNDPDLVAAELSPYEVESTMTNIIETGVQVQDYHQIRKISSNKVTFYEPLMHAVDASYGWTVQKYNHYEEVGIEGLSFVGHAKDDFVHHGDWQDDGAYKPVSFGRLVNSWIRNVDFVDVSEAVSITLSANVSVYSINITGNRGHSAIRSAGSSRVFIGAVTERTDGPLKDSGAFQEEAGQYHACGVSKQSMGAVIWRVHWGVDSCFESHATQPRATLIDCCKGAFLQLRQGGDYNQLPNHLDDLVIWNMCSEKSGESDGAAAPAGVFDWWRIGFKGWKFLPPVVVGFHGDPINFLESQMKWFEGDGTSPVEPQSLYEAQLERRLGYIPPWLIRIKSN